MTQNEFFNTLMDGLKDLPEQKLHDIISFYERNFNLGLAAGKTEEDIVNELGNLDTLIKEYRNNHINIPYYSENFATNASSDNIINKNPSVDINNQSNDTDKDINISNNIQDNDIISPNGDFYNISNSNISSNNTESNSKPFTSNILNHHSNNNNNKYDPNHNFNKPSQTGVNNILKICIVILALIIFFPVITGVIGFVIGLFGIAASIFIASIGILVGGTFTNIMSLPNVPAFVANFPYPVLVLFSLGSITLSILLTLLFYYLCKFIIRLLIKIYIYLKNKGGAF